MKKLLVAFACIPFLAACKKETPATAPAADTTPPAVVTPSDTTATPTTATPVETPATPPATTTEPAAAPAPAPGSGATGSSVGGSAEGSGDATYVVNKGDTLYGIAEKNGISHGDLAKWNNIDNPKQLRVGQKLRLTAP